jgi:hypothetical protein
LSVVPRIEIMITVLLGMSKAYKKYSKEDLHLSERRNTEVFEYDYDFFNGKNK